jgi:predicted Zn-dependent peptidase
VILEELAQYRDQPDAHVFDLAAEALWAGHALGRPLAGSPRTLAAVTSGSLEAFRRRHYRSDGAVLVAAGRVDPGELVARATPYAARLPQGDAPGFRRAGSATRLRALAVDARTIEQTHLVLAFRGFGRHDPRRHALRMLNVILGENMSSRLFQSLRERRGLAYSVASSVQLHDDSGALLIGAALDPARAVKAAALCVAELERLCERPVGRAEFVRARDYVVGQLRLGLETPESQMNWLGETLTGYGTFLSPDETIAGCRAVTPEALQTLARSLFRPSLASLALVLPKSAAGTAERLRATVDRLGGA